MVGLKFELTLNILLQSYETLFTHFCIQAICWHECS